MPTYDYVCEACEHAFEHYQSIKDDPIKKCPECGKKKLRRLIGPSAAIVFKGSGFYTTDYRSDAYKKAAAADKPAAASTSGDKSDGKSSGEKSASEKSGTEKSADSGGKKEKSKDKSSAKKS